MEWQTIETAPKDETEILLYCIDCEGRDVGCYVAKFFMKEWITIASIRLNCDDSDISDSVYPTHWMPLPKPPINNKKE